MGLMGRQSEGPMCVPVTSAWQTWSPTHEVGVPWLVLAQIQLCLSPGAETGSHVPGEVRQFTPVLFPEQPGNVLSQ
jgi:hypothetical protein